MLDDVNESNPPEDEQGFHFYYNHDERIKKAPQIVKDYYAGKMKPVRGVKVLFTKNNRYIFIALVIFVAFFYIYSGFNKSRNYAKINELDCELTAFVYEEQVFISTSVKRNPKSKKTNPENVLVEYSIYDVDKQIVHKETQSLTYENGEQYLRTKFYDYDIIRVDAVVTVGEESKEISTAVKR